MSSALSKRQTVRNERALQDLIKTVPGNNICADCQARNPGWASWSLGIFLCMRCAALHRKLGTHITKVKSLSMDSWTNEQVDHMKRVGNTASNRIYNPDNARAPIAFDADDADSAMERYIRHKYQDRVMQSQRKNHSGSTTSDEQQPPPLPPKTGSRFGFRSASSIFPLGKSKREAASARMDFESDRGRSPSPPRTNKQSRIFGTAVEAPDETDLKLAKLREMGFKDEKRNSAVLKGLGGNLEKSIETLARLGEGNGNKLSSKAYNTASNYSAPRTPASSNGLSLGVSVERTQENIKPPVRASTNPFDFMDAPPSIAQPQSAQSTGNMQSSTNPFQHHTSTNPFGLMPSQSQYNMNAAFQNMAVTPSQQPLFPHHTGGFPAPQSQQQQMYQQTMTPPMPSIPQRYHPEVIYENPIQTQNTGYNPFLQQPQPQPQPPQQQQQHAQSFDHWGNNPYAQQQVPSQSVYNAPVQQSPMQDYSNGNGVPQHQANPFFSQATQNPQQGYPQQQQQQQPQQSQYVQYQQQTYLPPAARPDKQSILDLYNYPQLAPTPIPQQQPQQQPQPEPENPQRKFPNPLTAQLANNRNPYSPAPVQHIPDTETMGKMGARHVSQESVGVVEGGWMNGRHSPDAWGQMSGSAR